MVVLVVIASMIYLLFHRSPNKSTPIHSRKDSTPETPPRSISSDKHKNNTMLPTTFAHVLPPSRRECAGSISPRAVNEETIQMHSLPMTMDYTTSPCNLYTSTGFSVGDILHLGDFPDYATLSGIPHPTPYPAHDINTAYPRPYRPFRWGYHQTMSLTKLEPDWWIELENTYKTRIAQRKELYAKHGTDVLNALPGSELACKELMEMVLQFICTRYPQHFTLLDNRVLQNHILHVEQDIRAKHPLEILLDHVPEDFALMMRDEKTGFYFLRAAVICSAVGWNVRLKIGRRLDEIHAPIPDYKEKMQFSMDRFFTKMPTDKAIQRGSWGLEVGEPLYMPPDDPHEAARLVQDPDLRIEDCTLRVDWQTLRRLPLSAAVVFNFKALFTPISSFRDEPAVPALLAKVLKDGKKSMLQYKGVWHVEHVILPKLEEWAKEQEEQGMVPKGWEVATLDNSPWFRGWQEKWHRQQGF
ncbi:hypothetical protein N7492_001645 [Penicillium capsulatum]|uniref:Alpha-1,2-mannosyltransferase n=1 Tax=Penicillium capsulatum TaxID=69766 RepID=A0A9W9M0H2_9EURO|nr:hypothetical protein N7492_001645 [Penicillium capsulatum]KAJ6129302.1 hypothetical protein N7512_002082 [Penicillium capsulatum]